MKHAPRLSRIGWIVFLIALVVWAPSALSAADREVVINEIMYHPPDDQDDLQYVELFNPGSSEVDLSGWSFTRGLKFKFPADTRLPAQSYLVVCRSVAAFRDHYPSGARVIGDFSGKLQHGGERLELSNADGKRIDSVKFSDRDPWPAAADGYGASLERVCPAAGIEGAANWASSSLPAMRTATGTPGRRNDSFHTNLPPFVSAITVAKARPGEATDVTAVVADGDGVEHVALLWRVLLTNRESDEREIVMERGSDDASPGTYRAAIPGQPEGLLVRFRIRATDRLGAARLCPSTNEPAPTYSFSTFRNTNSATVPFAYALRARATQPVPRVLRGSRLGEMARDANRGNAAFLYAPPGAEEVQVFDHVNVQPRGGGFKVHFLKHAPFRQMTTVNFLFEGRPRWVLSEPLSYEVYRRAGVPTPQWDYVRVWRDGRLLGYHLVIEQPNKSFLDRHGRDATGNLYKLIWQGSGMVGQHEKKTNPWTGHEDLVKLIQGLTRTSGTSQWELIQTNFNVELFLSYYAVNMCIENWDGFHNNYFLYHDTGGTGRWEIYPWDEDKTWGDYDGASGQYNWYQMPLTTGMKGDRSPRLDARVPGNNIWGAFGGLSWWRPGGWIAEPLLANAEFRRRFLARLGELCVTVFTENEFLPVIDQLEKRLAPEMAVRARASGRDVRPATDEFRFHLQTFRQQLIHRRKFILAELDRLSPASGVPGASR